MNGATDHRDIAAIVLAAGASRRLGSPKQLVVLDGETLVRRAVRCALEAGFSPVIVVASPDLAITDALNGLDAVVAINEYPSRGAASSVVTGIRTLSEIAPECSATAILLCDQPRVTARDLLSLKGAFLSSTSNIAAAEYNGQIGVPAIFGRRFFDGLLELAGDTGARFLIRENLHDCVSIKMDSAAFDVDTPDDIARLDALQPQN